MGIMIRGVCRSCDRTSPLTDHDNLWCQQCAEDPQRRRSMDDRRIARAFVWACSIFLIAMLYGFKYFYMVGHCQ